MSGTRRGRVPDMAAKSSVGSASRHDEGPPDQVVGRVVPAILGQEEQVPPAEDHHGRVRPFAERLPRGGLETVRQIDRVAERRRCGGRPAHGLGGGGGGMALEKPTRAPLGNRRTPRCSGRASSLLRQCHRLPQRRLEALAAALPCCAMRRACDNRQRTALSRLRQVHPVGSLGWASRLGLTCPAPPRARSSSSRRTSTPSRCRPPCRIAPQSSRSSRRAAYGTRRGRVVGGEPRACVGSAPLVSRPEAAELKPLEAEAGCHGGIRWLVGGGPRRHLRARSCAARVTG